MKRIGIYLSFPPEGGGVFQYTQSILTALAALPQSEYKIIVLHSHQAWAKKLDGYGSRFEHGFIKEGIVDVIVRVALRFGFPLSVWRAVAKSIHPLTRRILGYSCDLWVFPDQDVLTYSLPAPVLGAIHDLMHRYEPGFPEVSAFGLFRRRERHYRRICSHVRGLLVDSEMGKQQVIESYAIPEKDIFVLPYVAPGYIFNGTPPVDFDLRYHLPEKFIFYPAQFWEHKNHSRLLQAMANVSSSLPDLHLVLSGSEKNAYSKVLRAIKTLGIDDRVHILGYIPDEDIAEIYRRARALILPTFFGPTNIPPLEAMAAGCPMAVSDIYGMPEQIGDAALYFDPSSVEAIATSIRLLATDDELCRKLVAAGRKQTLRLSQQQFNERFRAITESVLGV